MRTVHLTLKTMALLAAIAATTPAEAQQLTEFDWDSSKTGPQLWQQSSNWIPAGIPNGPLHVGDLSRPLAANLNVNIGTGVTVAGVRIGGTAGPVTTEIASNAGGLLTFRSDEMPPMLIGNADFNGDSFVHGHDFLIWQRNIGATGQMNNNLGDADASGVVDGADLDIWRMQFGRGSEIFSVGSAFIDSNGAAGAVNTISASVHIDNEQLEIAGTRNLTINSPLSYIGDPNNAGVSAAAIRAITPNQTVTINGNLAIANNDATNAVDFRINDSERNQGTIVFNGVISGEGQLFIGAASNSARLPLGTVVLNGANTFTGGIQAGRGNLVLGSNDALGTSSSYRQAGPANQFGYNLLSTDDARVISKPLVIAQWQTIKGDHSLEWAGEIEQTNNRGLVNLLPAGKELKLSGRINIFEEAEPGVVRRFEIHGTGKTRITGSVRNLPDDAVATPQDHRLVKKGLGVLILDVAAGNNNHIGDDVIFMGNWHYVNNNSLNVGGGQILSHGGAIGVDIGVSNNTDFLSRIRPASTGGIQLAASDAAATLDFTSTMTNAANMTVAAPETGLTFTGSIIPAGGRYQLGGGTGTLTLPNAQLTGGNRLEVRNGGTVQLLGDNTYTGSTTILTKYTSTNDAVAAADSSNTNLSVGTSYYSQVAPTLVVDKLSNGGVASSIGAASSDAANLFIQGGTLKYVGTGDSTNRLFTIGTGGATLDASGAGAVAFTNTGAVGRDEAEDRTGTLDDFNRNPDQLYDLTDTSDIIVGMTVTDPDPGGIGAPPLTPPLIPAGTTVTGVSDDGTTLGLSNEYGFRFKQNTRLVFGTVPRTLTLTGSNTGSNTIASLISNSDKGGVVGITKTGAGTWVLTGNNTYTGPTTVQQGTLSAVAMGGNLVLSGGTVAPGVGVGTLSVGGSFTQSAGAALAIDLASASSFDVVNVTGGATLGGSIQVSLLGGFNPAVGSTFDVLTSSSLNISGLSVTGPGGWSASAIGNTLRLTRTALGTIAGAAVPEPSSLALAALAAIGLRRSVRRGVPRAQK
jgi:autotransporter-associated beta strand protein